MGILRNREISSLNVGETGRDAMWAECKRRYSTGKLGGAQNWRPIIREQYGEEPAEDLGRVQLPDTNEPHLSITTQQLVDPVEYPTRCAEHSSVTFRFIKDPHDFLVRLANELIKLQIEISKRQTHVFLERRGFAHARNVTVPIFQNGNFVHALHVY